MTIPLLSVVIPTWNRAGVICEAVDSALKQRPGHIQIIVVDDASTDNTMDLVTKTFGSAVELLRLAGRTGAGAARNAGARLARGEWVAFLDSDDVWLPGKLDAELEVLERFGDAEAVISDSRHSFENQADDLSRFAQSGLPAQGRACWASECAWLWTNSANIVHTSSMTVRRGVLGQIGEPLFPTDVLCCEDWEFQMKIYQRRRVVVLPQVWTLVRRYDDNSRPGRAIPGSLPTKEQKMRLLQDRLTVMGRSQWLKDLNPELLDEFERFRFDTTNQLQDFRIRQDLHDLIL